MKSIIDNLRIMLQAKKTLYREIEIAQSTAEDYRLLYQREVERSNSQRENADFYQAKWRAEQKAHGAALDEIHSLKSRIVIGQTRKAV